MAPSKGREKRNGKNSSSLSCRSAESNVHTFRRDSQEGKCNDSGITGRFEMVEGGKVLKSSWPNLNLLNLIRRNKSAIQLCFPEKDHGEGKTKKRLYT
jgi:hypothetical protein